MDALDHLRPLLAEFCARHGVLRLELFGSAARGEAEPGDLDLLVTFAPMPPALHAAAYFGLLADLERELGRPVDLVELAPIRNPYFLQSIQQDKVLLFAA